MYTESLYRLEYTTPAVLTIHFLFSRVLWFERRTSVCVDVPSFGQWVTIFYRLNFENPPTVLTPR